MNIAAYKPIIVKELEKSSGKKMTADQVAESIIDRITDLEEALLAMGGQAIVLAPPVSPKPELGRQSAEHVFTETPDSLDTDVSMRLRAEGEPEPKGLIERYSVDQLLDFARNEMPSQIEVHPPGFAKPFTIKKFVEPAPAGMGFVRIVYQQEEAPIMTDNGQRVGPTVQISTTGDMLNGDKFTADIITQANGMYSATPKVLTPRQPPAVQVGNLRQALGADIGRNEAADSVAMSTWAHQVAEDPLKWSAKAAWNGVRKVDLE